MCCIQADQRERLIREVLPSTLCLNAHDFDMKELKSIRQPVLNNGKESFEVPLSQAQQSSSYISSNHSMKIVWDVLTILLSLTVGVYTTHASMRDQCFPHLLNNNCVALHQGRALPLFFGYFHGSTVVTLYDLWRVADIVLNFLTEDAKHVNKNKNGCSEVKHHSAALTYLKTWFLIDLITLLSWEVLYVQPVFNKNHKKNILLKAIGLIRKFPSLCTTGKRCPRLLRILKWAISFAGRRSLGKLIRYAPKYIDFALTGNMKVVIALRVIRQVRLLGSLISR